MRSANVFSLQRECILSLHCECMLFSAPRMYIVLCSANVFLLCTANVFLCTGELQDQERRLLLRRPPYHRQEEMKCAVRDLVNLKFTCMAAPNADEGIVLWVSTATGLPCLQEENGFKDMIEN